MTALLYHEILWLHGPTSNILGLQRSAPTGSGSICMHARGAPRKEGIDIVDLQSHVLRIARSQQKIKVAWILQVRYRTYHVPIPAQMSCTPYSVGCMQCMQHSMNIRARKGALVSCTYITCITGSLCTVVFFFFFFYCYSFSVLFFY